MTGEAIGDISGRPDLALPLRGDDLLYSGKFRFDRDAVLHRTASGFFLLVWNGDQMVVRHRTGPIIGNQWALGADDRVVLGDFHRIGPDVVDAPADTVIDGLTDVFLHNAWGTGMLGVNHGPVSPGDPAERYLDQMGLTWIQRRRLMRD